MEHGGGAAVRERERVECGLCLAQLDYDPEPERVRHRVACVSIERGLAARLTETLAVRLGHRVKADLRDKRARLAGAEELGGGTARVKVCPSCQGQRSAVGRLRPCRTCGGDGTVPV